MKASRIYRLMRIVTILRSGRTYTANDLASELEVSRRTVFRDLNMLEMAHIPYYFDQDKNGYRINDHFFLPPVNLTLTEALAVLLLTGSVRKGTKLPLVSDGARAAIKIQSVLPPVIRKELGGMVDRLSFFPAAMARQEGLDAVFNDLAHALASRTICELLYDSLYEKKQIVTRIRPLRLAFVSRSWYVIAYSSMHREIRTFKLPRITKLTVTNKTFEKPRNVDLEKYFGDAWGMIPEGKIYNVHLHFAPKVATNVAEVRWAESQKVEWNEDGSIEFRVRVDGLGEITWWILGYGDQVRVVSPRSLRKRIADVAGAVVKAHREKRT